MKRGDRQEGALGFNSTTKAAKISYRRRLSAASLRQTQPVSGRDFAALAAVLAAAFEFNDGARENEC